MPEKAAFFHFYSASCFIPGEISGLGLFLELLMIPEYFQFFSSFFAKYYAYYKILQCRASSLEAQFAGPNAQGGVRQPLDARESAAHSALAPRNLPGVTTS